VKRKKKKKKQDSGRNRERCGAQPRRTQPKQKPPAIDISKPIICDHVCTRRKQKRGGQIIIFVGKNKQASKKKAIFLAEETIYVSKPPQRLFVDETRENGGGYSPFCFSMTRHPPGQFRQ
jgi:hypothetical protein